ncbi:DUF3306 domain-containing protein [Vibrio campbellii]|uniref:DUF3306 domain-containing protein n=2 Tax=Vibrio campbellii TaxID=680 RepID=A7N0S8_VIBC1|nr:DUF3306 domain-containing protein [Vibrio campbellii]ABU71235.1 hypothetical protein VIBHAR_02273 [Vibrio campbellii ATCC BAA-1116]AGU93909.1 hypothetical protein M892_01995 [Vibrio campbellii ATCC BAA-1116]MBT0121596.1 DUF3306 domain-containing protein [Vibrio campbellii]MBT0136733.1 DUF3306 domain-containing protein [Vibrio campbellii]MBT0141389.1 DUF3306 domain-containing protein [Vibrio campbellii]
MATSFFSRWSKRKLEETTAEPSDAKSVDSVESTEPETAQAHAELSTEAQALATEASVTETESQQTSSETTDPEEMSVAQLLVSEASESVKKAALRKMFLSEEFNVRDGLDDYDDDYSNLKSLSEGVAETLRDWVKEKTEEEPAKETKQSTESHGESDIESADVELAEGAEIPEEQKELDINTASNKSDILETKLASEEVGQNIPHKE